MRKIMSRIVKLWVMGIIFVGHKYGKEVMYIQSKMTGLPDMGKGGMKEIGRLVASKFGIWTLKPYWGEWALGRKAAYDEYMQLDYWMIDQVGAIITDISLQPDNSKGCKLEQAYAAKQNKPVIKLDLKGLSSDRGKHNAS